MPKRYFVILSLALTITCSSARAQNVALSYLGMCHPKWPCEKSIQAFDGLPVIRFGWLEQTFGEQCPCVDKLLQDERPKEVRVHIANGPCLRNKRCGRYEVFAGETIGSAQRAIKATKPAIIRKYVRILDRLRSRLAKSRGALTCYVSPVLESDFDGRTRKILHSLTASYLPSCTLVDNPLRGNCIRGVVCERHGPNPGLTSPCIADLDGIDANEISVPKFLRNTKACDMSFVWSVGLNCNGHHGQTFIDPRKRDCVQTGADIEALTGWLRREFK
jgi:hypothetical protein